MKRFPFMTLYRRLLIGLAGLLVIAAFIGGMALIISTNQLITSYSASGFPPDVVNNLRLARTLGFVGIYIIGIFFALVIFLFAEFIKMGLSIEDHLYALRNVNKPLMDIRQSVRAEMAAQQTLGEAKALASNIGSLVKSGFKGAKEAIQSEMEKRNTGQVAAVTPPEKPPTQSSRPPTQSRPTTETQQLRQVPPPIMQTQSVPVLPDAAIAFKEALSHAKKGDYPAAIKSADLVLQLDPGFDKAIRLREECERRLKQQGA